MIILHAIREADSEHEVYELLSAYSEAVDVDGAGRESSSRTSNARITDAAAVARRIEALVAALQEASKRLDDRARLLIKEALHVFCAALDRLELLGEAPGARREVRYALTGSS
ncbi:MAG TPA: hypothetical protein VEV20_01500 [Burkholderiales bacterium]|nr:hypothetical protein [Burkholderiales bacterium]